MSTSNSQFNRCLACKASRQQLPARLPAQTNPYSGTTQQRATTTRKTRP